MDWDYIIRLLLIFGQRELEKILQQEKEGKNNLDKTIENKKEYWTSINKCKDGVEQPFLLPIEDVFTITGIGTTVTGRVERGVIKVGDYVEIVGFKDTKLDIVTAVEAYKKLLDEGKPGEYVGIVLKYSNKSDVERGIVLAKPNSIKAYKKFFANIHLFTKEEFENCLEVTLQNESNANFYFRTTDVYGKINLPQGQKEVKSGDYMNISVELSEKIALEIGTRFAVRIKDGENDIGKTIGCGYVKELIE